MITGTTASRRTHLAQNSHRDAGCRDDFNDRVSMFEYLITFILAFKNCRMTPETFALPCLQIECPNFTEAKRFSRAPRSYLRFSCMPKLFHENFTEFHREHRLE